MAPDYENLALLQKVEVFEYSQENTNGQDLYNILWLKSKNSETWLERRTNYTRSLAVMSMVGYVLGLGDRHPSNLMLDQLSGNVVHIDFGDCFEVCAFVFFHRCMVGCDAQGKIPRKNSFPSYSHVSQCNGSLWNRWKLSNNV